MNSHTTICTEHTHTNMHIHVLNIQLNLTIMNPGRDELTDTTNTDLRMFTHLLYCK